MVQDVVPRNRIRQIHYADYRQITGLLVPFSISQTGGLQPCTIQLNQIIFNSGLQPSDFQL